MCFSNTIAKILDPAGPLVERAAPKAFKPYSSLYGTSKAMRELQAPIQPSPLTVPKPASQKLLGE